MRPDAAAKRVELLDFTLLSTQHKYTRWHSSLNAAGPACAREPQNTPSQAVRCGSFSRCRVRHSGSTQTAAAAAVWVDPEWRTRQREKLPQRTAWDGVF